MKVDRVIENLRMQDEISMSLVSPDIARNIILMDISRSLSVIADELTRKESDNDNR